ncbi:MAG: hypothetical protein ACK4M1_09855 [Flavobacterium sp.]
MRFLKIIINIIATFGMYIHIDMCYTYWKIGDCHKMFEIVKNTGISLLPETIIFIISITFLNFIIERKLEKRKNSKEFIWLFILQFITVSLIIIYNAYKAYISWVCN